MRFFEKWHDCSYCGAKNNVSKVTDEEAPYWIIVRRICPKCLRVEFAFKKHDLEWRWDTLEYHCRSCWIRISHDDIRDWYVFWHCDSYEPEREYYKRYYELLKSKHDKYAKEWEKQTFDEFAKESYFDSL